MFLVDSHCHLNLLDLTNDDGDLNRVMQRAKDANVLYLLNVCVALSTFNMVLADAEKYNHVGASLGSHPNEKDEDVNLENLMTLGAHPKVIAIGETGLDYFRSTGQLDWQRERFRTHIHAAKKLNKPLIIHTRDAREDTIAIMRQENAAEIGGVMHCFSEDLDTAKAALDMGFYISFSGILTFKNATTIQAVAKEVPLNRILIETDSPYLAPMPYRGKQNEPAYVRNTAAYLATLRGISLEEVATATTNNFFNLFKGAVKPHV